MAHIPRGQHNREHLSLEDFYEEKISSKDYSQWTKPLKNLMPVVVTETVTYKDKTTDKYFPNFEEESNYFDRFNFNNLNNRRYKNDE